MNINLTLLGQMITFALLVWVTMKYIWPPITNALQQRQKKIADGLAAAERGKHEQELAEKRAKEVLNEARQEASNIVSQAQKRSAQIVDEAKEEAREEAERVKSAAESELEQEMNQAREQLRARVAELAVAGAERILQREVKKEDHKKILDDLAKQL